MPIKEIQAGYLTSPYFKNIFIFCEKINYLLLKAATRQVDTQVERYLLLNLIIV